MRAFLQAAIPNPAELRSLGLGRLVNPAVLAGENRSFHDLEASSVCRVDKSLSL